MPEYGLTKDGATIASFREFVARPVNPRGKPGWRWLTVTRQSVEHDKEGSTVLDTRAGTVTISTPEAPPVTHMDPRDFMDRISRQKQIAIVTAAQANASIDWFLRRLYPAVNIASPDTETAIDALISAGLLDTDDKAALLAPIA